MDCRTVGYYRSGSGIICSQIVGLQATVGVVLFSAQACVLGVHKAGFNSQHQQKEHPYKTELALSTLLSRSCYVAPL